MMLRLLLVTGTLALPAALAPARLAPVASSSTAADATPLPPVPWVRDDPADSLYKAAREALNRNDFTRAATLFGEVTRRFPNSAYAADAPYWRAYSLYRAGGEGDLREALRTLDTQKARFPKAATIGDGNTLALRIRGTLAKRGDADAAEAVSSAASTQTTCSRGGDDGDDEGDMRMAALNALLQMDSERALPIIKQVLRKRDACSAGLRRKAVFLLSQKQSAETEDLMLDVIHNDPSHDVREQAVFWMGQLHTDKAAAALEEIATRSPDESLRTKAVFALSQQGTPRGQALLRRFAEAGDTPRQVREQAIFWLGQRRSTENAEFLRSLFGKLGKSNDELRKNVLFSLSQMKGLGNDRWLLGVALDRSQDDDVRKHALWTAGQAGIPASELLALYDKLGDAELKGQLIWVLAESHDKAATDKLIEIAKGDRDPEMRKKALFWLGQKHDPRVQQLLLDIINKG